MEKKRSRPFLGKMEKVDSTNVSAIGRDGSIVRVLFRNGRLYEYYGVTDELWNSRESYGRFSDWFKHELQKKSKDYTEIKNEAARFKKA